MTLVILVLFIMLMLTEKITVLEDRNTALVNQVSDLVRERNEQDAKLDELIDALESRVAKWQVSIREYKTNRYILILNYE